MRIRLFIKEQANLICLVLLCVLNSFGIALGETKAERPEPVVSASLDRSSVRVGDMVWLTLKYDLPEGARLPEKAEIKGIEGLTVTKRFVENDQIKIRLLVDRLGAWQSEPISLTYLDKDGNEQTMNADPVSINVLSNLGEKPEEARLRPIQDIIPIGRRWLAYLPWAAALVGLLIIADLIWWYRKRHPRDIVPEVIEPPHIRARKEIDQLEAQGLFEKGKAKAFYFIFSEIMRRYMESIRHFPAAEYTTEEIAPHIHTNEADRKILPLLRQADLVKFADTVPTLSCKDEDIRAARSYIEETSPASDHFHESTEAREEP